MAKGIGRIFQVGIAKESTRGTAQSTATFWIPFSEVAIEEKDTKIYEEQAYGVIEETLSSTIIKQWTEGTLKAPVGDRHFGLILLSALGAVSVATHAGESAVYDHTLTVQQASQHQSLTLFIRDPITNVDYKHALGVVSSLEILYELGKFIDYSANFRAKKGVSTSLTPSITAENKFVHKHVTFKTATNLAGLAAAPSIQLKALTLTITKNIEEDDILGSIAPNDFLNKHFTIEGKLEAHWINETDFKANALTATPKALRIQLVNSDVTIGTASNPSITIDLAKVTFVDITRPIHLNEIVKQSLSFKAHYSTSDAKMVTALITNQITSY